MLAGCLQWFAGKNCRKEEIKWLAIDEGDSN
jgi:hypothetical protein